MEERENIKFIPVLGRKFYTTKMDAFRANYLLGESRRILPSLGFGDLIGVTNTASVVTEEEFIKFQKKCLSYCYEKLPAGDTKVIDEEGNFAVMGLDNQPSAVLALVLAVVVFNIQGFFDEDPSSSPLELLQTTFPSIAKT